MQYKRFNLAVNKMQQKKTGKIDLKISKHSPLCPLLKAPKGDTIIAMVA